MTTPAGLPRDVESALGDIGRTLALDGYVGRYEVDAAALRYTVDAGENACEDCLSPEPVLRRMLEQTLAKAGLGLAVHIRYPGQRPGVWERT